jgi:hypothetical protein
MVVSLLLTVRRHSVGIYRIYYSSLLQFFFSSWKTNQTTTSGGAMNNIDHKSLHKRILQPLSLSISADHVDKGYIIPFLIY